MAAEMTGAVAALLPGNRLHLQHGPIDIIAGAFGPADAVQAAYVRAVARFASILTELCAELPALRHQNAPLYGRIARRMAAATAPYRPAFITPMAAVAGSVADEIIAHLTAPGITGAYANNGGDIALWLAPDQHLTCAFAVTAGLDNVTIRHSDQIRGIATSGWRGRSFSLGIADAVTVLAKTAAMADAAATMIANAVNLTDHPGIARSPARSLQADSDLGALLVTVGVPPLAVHQRDKALMTGLKAAQAFQARGLIEGAALFLQGDSIATGAIALPVQESADV